MIEEACIDNFSQMGQFEGTGTRQTREEFSVIKQNMNNDRNKRWTYQMRNQYLAKESNHL